ncbi:MAG: hypothetical protein LBR97_02905 [Dysgonamonadaceae bacterium]|nr:hypothetical protein [Dysgonamonadaceae bacterium]
MKKDLLIYQIIFSFFILSFSSCINPDFDFDDEKLDTNVTLGSNINLPVGDIQEISVYEELKKVYDKLEVGTDGVLYIGYDGTFPVEFPDYETPTVERLVTESRLDDDITGTVTIPAATESTPLIQDQKVKYEVSSPDLVGENDNLSITPKKIGFGSFILETGFELSNINFTSYGSGAKLTVSLTFSDNYILKGYVNQIKKSVLISSIINNSYCSLGEIEVDSYTFDGREPTLTYSVTLEGGNEPITLTATDPKFKFILDSGDMNVSYLDCTIDGKKDFSGTENGFGDLQGAFSDSDILQFRNPALSLNLTTNLGTDFKLGLDLSRSDGISASLGDNNLLSFKKPAEGSTETQSYELTPQNLVNFDNVISTPFPEELAYTVKLFFDNQDATLLPSDQLELSADYSFKIPFDFKKINLSLKDTITDLFDEDTYEQVFSYAKEDVSIEADLVEVSIGGGGIKLDISAAILDSNFNEIIDLGSVLKDNNTLLIAIKGDDLKKMENARHLAFIFRLSGAGAIKIEDYIKINGLRLVSGSGIHYEF